MKLPSLGHSVAASDTRSPWMAFWAAFLVRVAYMTLAHTYRFPPYSDHFSFGWEMGRIGRALAWGRGFADPFRGHTGPTAWTGPLYPLLVAGVFRLAGVYTLLSSWILLTINSLLSALIVFPVAAIGRRAFMPSVSRWAVWMWTLYPAAMQYAVRWVWETTLSTLLFTCAFALALRMREQAEREGASAPRDWAVFGLLWGATSLSNPALVVFLPCAGLWVLWGALFRPQIRARGRALAGAVLGGAIFLVVLSPWAARNLHVFHHFVPLRGNFGVEMALGNGPGAHGLLMEYHHPGKDPVQLRLYAAMGEYRYAQMRGELAQQTIRADPGLFLRNTLKRIYFFWYSTPQSAPFWISVSRSLNFGFLSTAGLLGLLLALRRRIEGAWLFALAFLSLPAVYYLVTVHARFRHPLEPLIALLAVYLFQSAEARPKPRPESAGSPVTAG